MVIGSALQVVEFCEWRVSKVNYPEATFAKSAKSFGMFRPKVG